MNTKFGIVISTAFITLGVIIGVSVRKDHTVTQLVGVPMRSAQVNETVDAVTPAPPQVATDGDGAIHTATATASTYTAQPGDTLSNVAKGLFGQDSKANRDAVVDANPSLQANPDLVVSGQEYRMFGTGIVIPPSDTAPAKTSDPAAVVAAAPVPVAGAPVASTPVLKYTAADGDTVNNLAGALLGANTQTNRDAIVNANPSLKVNPDHLVAGKAYRIPAPEGGLVAASIPAAEVAPRPTTQPDEDQIVRDNQPRALRYTAKSGDTVSSLAQALLGSDTQANRDKIIETNVSLKANPDKVIEGKTYWIPAPAAPVADLPQGQ